MLAGLNNRGGVNLADDISKVTRDPTCRMVKVVLAGLVGYEAILRAMRSNEADANTAYERAVQFPDLDAGIRGSLEAALADERRHAAWIMSQIA